MTEPVTLTHDDRTIEIEGVTALLDVVDRYRKRAEALEKHAEAMAASIAAALDGDELDERPLYAFDEWMLTTDNEPA